MKEDKEKNKEAADKEKERVEELKDKLGDKFVTQPNPIVQSFRTFDYWTKYYKKNPPNPYGKKGPGFGTEQRFGVNEKEKYQKQVKLYNAGNPEGKELDAKADPVPGPGYYKLQEVWNGKKVKLRRPYSSQPKVGEQIQRKISKGVQISGYYQRI